MFQAALTVHDIDADSARGTSIITDDRSSCWFSDDEEVRSSLVPRPLPDSISQLPQQWPGDEASQCVYVTIIFTFMINP